MAVITEKGKRLADQIGRIVGTTPQMRAVCSLICRKAQTHYNYSVLIVNGGVWLAERTAPSDEIRRNRIKSAEDNIERLEKAIDSLVRDLPSNQGVDPRVTFNETGLSIRIYIRDDQGHDREFPVEVYRG